MRYVKLGLAVACVAFAGSARAQQVLEFRGTTTVQGSAPAVDGIGTPEIDPGIVEADVDVAGGRGVVNRTIGKGPGKGPSASSGPKAKSNPQLVRSFEGLNLYQQRYANGGNQFTVEPPDQALCVGNGFVLEAVNDVLRIWDTSGNSLSTAVDLNTFYHYPAAINRSNGKYGPSITDPTCYFDPDTQRWFVVVLTLDRVGTSSTLSGINHLDIAVSSSADPRGAWVIYKLDSTDNGKCDGPPGYQYCLGDYPQIGADANTFVITVNSFPWFANGFRGAVVYAIQKKALAANANAVYYTTYDTSEPQYLLDGTPGFTVRPAVSPAGIYDTSANGTEFMVSSQAVWNDSGVDGRLRVWSLTNTASLGGIGVPSGAPVLSSRVLNTLPYAVPPLASQKASGNFPLGTYLGDNIGPLDASDSRVTGIAHANGKLWVTLGTALSFGSGADVVGAAYYVFNPHSLVMNVQGYVGVPGNYVTYPSVAATPSGRGVIGFTLSGPDHHPSAGFAGVDAIVGAGAPQTAAAGQSPQDGFTEYPQYSNRPRWGDYGAAVADGNTIWIASEYVQSNCTVYQWLGDFTCGHTRAQLGNWSTRITQLKP